MKKIRNEEKIKRIIYSVAALAICVATLLSFWLANKDNTGFLPDDTTAISTTESTTKETPVNMPVTDIPDERYNTETTTKEVVSVYFAYPLNNKISKEYSDGEIVKNTTTDDWRTHNGIDISGTSGDQINSICDGQVTAVRNDELWGAVVTIDHGNGITADYFGLQIGSTVQPGDKVKTNQKIGLLGEIPIESADGVHLHLEMHKDGITVSPTNYLDKRIEF